MIPIQPKQPSLGGKPDYSSAIYVDPPSHDFCVWLVIAELMRRTHACTSPLRVHLGLKDGWLGAVDFGPFSIKSQQAYPSGYTKAYSDKMIPNICRPAIEMIGATECELANDTFVEYDYHIGHLVDAGRAGFTPPHWTPPEWARTEVKAFLAGSKPVVITLRECDYQPERNSQLTQWLRFAHSIKKQHPVLFVRDTAKVKEPLGLPTYPRASENTYVRAALCEYALCNLYTQNGPIVWSVFSPNPYLVFKQLVPALPDWAHGRAEGWKDQDHMDVGDQYPWASPLQRLTWKDDTVEAISEEFAQWLKPATASTLTSSPAAVSAGTVGPTLTLGSPALSTES